MKKILMSVLGLMLMFSVASRLTAADDQKPQKEKIGDVVKSMTADQKKQFDQLKSDVQGAAKEYKQNKNASNEKKLKEAIKARIEFIGQVSGHEVTNIDEMVNEQFKKVISAQPAKKVEKKQ